MQSRTASAFEIYLRTGRRVRAGVEVKFNPWHDPKNGRFTFAGQGRHFAGDGQDTRSGARRRREAQPSVSTGGHIGFTDAFSRNTRDESRNDPKNPINYSLYTVQRGDTLTRIAKQRKHIDARDLAWLNDISVDQPLRIGQKLKLPHQEFRDRGIEAWQKFRALDHYLNTHDRRMPPLGAKLPPVEQQILDTNWRRESRGNYEFQIDPISRPRRIYGPLSFTLSPVRSRRNQAQAGKPDRRASDDGGHYIAARFNGPRDGFNHFAQDANFNRGGYRVLEDGWAKEMRAGHKMFVDIAPHYAGTSQRPDHIDVTWYVDGKKHSKSFPNEATGRSDGKR